MRSDHDINQSFFQIGNGLFLFRRCPETAHQIDAHRKILHSLHKCIVMLLRQNCRRHQIGHLLAVLYCLKGCTDRDLCLAVAHITADEAVHDLPALHVFLGGVNGI